MGNVVKTLSKNVFKKVRRFNIENRTDRFLDKKVKVVPPKPQATLLEIQKINREMPDLMKQINEPNPQLLDRLKNVYVSSTDKLPDCSTSSEDPRKQLPVQRTSLRESFGYVEPTSLTPGRISLQEALKLLVKYYQDKKANNPQRLALQFNLSEKNVESILENFKLFSYVDTDPKKIQIGVPLGNMMKSLEADPINTINYPQKLIELNAKAKSPTLNTLQEIR